MDKIEKLLKKIKKQDRQRLLELVEKLTQGETKGLNIVKIKTTDFHRLRTGHFRIIFHYNQGETIIDSIKLRNKKTYKQ